MSENAGELEQLALSSRDAVALLTHSFEQDRNLLGKLLPLDLRYLGLLGARHRSRLLLTEAAAHLRWSPEQALQRVHAPIGLELGGDSPEAVALAILAEIQAALYQKTAISRGMSREDFLAAPDRPYVPVRCRLDSAQQGQGSSDPVHVVETAR
jgi:xanthine/CO dehydrogenase XdhC/CoxF family maturation factor